MDSFTSCSESSCVGWIRRYFKDCVCDLSSEMSFFLGLVSLVCWGVAEIPQIITNFQTKSCHGVSIAFLLTWIFGDIFNLVGCLLEPVTLPTQFYTALLYTISTVVLFLQTIYYDYCRRWWKSKDLQDQAGHQVQEEKQPLNPKPEDPSKPFLSTTPTSPLPARASPQVDMYYMSARSLASGGTPPYGSPSYYLGTARSGPSGGAMGDDDSSSDEDNGSPTPASHRHSSSRPTRIASRSAGYGTFFASAVALPYQGKALMEAHMGLSGRRLLQDTRMNATETNTVGLLLGWIMAVIYMGGRLPQIYLNIKRGSVEGLNPFMFLFALIANATYVGSILVRSVEWEKIEANAPWLLDAVGCVLLDLFIIVQFGYYKLKHKNEARQREVYDDYMEAKKVPV